MKTLRTMLFWTHLAAGLAAGAVILIMSVTGAALALKPQILRAIDRDVRLVEPAGRAPLAPSQLLSAAAPSAGSPVTSLAIERDSTAAATLGAGGKTLFVNPYTGEALGTPSSRAQAIFRSIENWHRWIAFSGDGRAAGRALTGASNLAFLALALSGLYLWWPRSWTPQHTRAILWFRRTATGRARDFNWHNVIGFWCLPLIIVMAASGVVMSYPWANALLYRVTRSEPPVPVGRPAGPAEGRDAAPASPATDAGVLAAIDRAWGEAQRRVPEWRAITLRVPARAGAPLAVTITDGASWNPFARSQLTVDGLTGEMRQWTPYAAQSLGQRARGWVRFGHTGELFGLPGQVLAGIGCLGGVFLVGTGVSLAVRRFVAWSARRRAAAAREAVAVGFVVSGEGKSSS